MSVGLATVLNLDAMTVIAQRLKHLCGPATTTKLRLGLDEREPEDRTTRSKAVLQVFSGELPPVRRIDVPHPTRAEVVGLGIGPAHAEVETELG